MEIRNDTITHGEGWAGEDDTPPAFRSTVPAFLIDPKTADAFSIYMHDFNDPRKDVANFRYEACFTPTSNQSEQSQGETRIITNSKCEYHCMGTPTKVSISDLGPSDGTPMDPDKVYAFSVSGTGLDPWTACTQPFSYTGKYTGNRQQKSTPQHMDQENVEDFNGSLSSPGFDPFDTGNKFDLPFTLDGFDGNDDSLASDFTSTFEADIIRVNRVEALEKRFEQIDRNYTQLYTRTNSTERANKRKLDEIHNSMVEINTNTKKNNKRKFDQIDGSIVDLKQVLTQERAELKREFETMKQELRAELKREFETMKEECSDENAPKRVKIN